MISDIETILTAFVGTWKPGIEEQSIRMAHAVALQGDTATASNILKFVAIPEAMKLQILGASLGATIITAANPVATAPTTETIVGPAKTMPEPLLSDHGVDAGAPMKIPVASESDVANVHEVVPPTIPAFSSDLVTEVTVSNESISVTPQQKILPDTPVGSQAFERQVLFDRAFANVQSQAALDTSKPMIKDADNIPVIHTYAEPEQSAREIAQDNSVLAQKGIKMFDALNVVLARVVTQTDAELRASTVKQWERLNNEFPEYQKFHRPEWLAMENMVTQLKLPLLVTTTPQTVEDKTDPSVIDGVVEPVQAFIATPPITAPVATPVTGGYFARKTAAPAIPHEVSLTPAETDVLSSGRTELSSISLVGGGVVTRNMTITGNSIYRVESMYSEGSQTTVVFTDEIHRYLVPLQPLSDALSNPDTQADAFFEQYIESRS